MIFCEETLRHLQEFYFRVATPAEFEKWLYSDQTRESALGAESYFNLIDVDYSKNSEIDRARLVVSTIYPGKLDGLIAAFAKDSAEAALNGNISLDRACRKLAELETSGETKLPAIFDFIVDALDRGTSAEHLREDMIEALENIRDSSGVSRSGSGVKSPE